MDSILAPDRVITSDQLVLDNLRSAGFRQHDEWFYPSGDPSRAAVRLSVFQGEYQIWRRRKLTSPWMLIVTDDTKNFDQVSFRTWKDSWPLAH